MCIFCLPEFYLYPAAVAFMISALPIDCSQYANDILKNAIGEFAMQVFIEIALKSNMNGGRGECVL